jgi:hypothetical protein
MEHRRPEEQESFELEHTMDEFVDTLHRKIVNTSLEIVKIAVNETMAKLTVEIEAVARSCNHRINLVEDMVEQWVGDLRLEAAHSIVDAVHEVEERQKKELMLLKDFVNQETDDNDATLSDALDKVHARIDDIVSVHHLLDKSVAALQKEIQTQKTVWRSIVLSGVAVVLTGCMLAFMEQFRQ